MTRVLRGSTPRGHTRRWQSGNAAVCKTVAIWHRWFDPIPAHASSRSATDGTAGPEPAGSRFDSCRERGGTCRASHWCGRRSAKPSGLDEGSIPRRDSRRLVANRIRQRPPKVRTARSTRAQPASVFPAIRVTTEYCPTSSRVEDMPVITLPKNESRRSTSYPWPHRRPGLAGRRHTGYRNRSEVAGSSPVPDAEAPG